MQKISSDDWSQWEHSPVTQAVRAYLEEMRDDEITKMLNLQATPSLEEYAIKAIALRHVADGLARATDFETLKRFLVEEKNERA